LARLQNSVSYIQHLNFHILGDPCETFTFRKSDFKHPSLGELQETQDDNPGLWVCVCLCINCELHVCTVWCGVLVCAHTCVNRGRDRVALLTVTVLNAAQDDKKEF